MPIYPGAVHPQSSPSRGIIPGEVHRGHGHLLSPLSLKTEVNMGPLEERGPLYLRLPRDDPSFLLSATSGPRWTAWVQGCCHT